MIRIIHNESVVFSDESVDKAIDFINRNNYMIVDHDLDDNGDMVIEVWERSTT